MAPTSWHVLNIICSMTSGMCKSDLEGTDSGQAKWSLLDEGTYKIDLDATSPSKEVNGVKVLWR